MAATKYQILYKMTNPNSNTMINNIATEDISQFIDMFHDQHKLELGTVDEKMEATNEINQRIQQSSDPTNEKYNSLYQYDGTRRLNKRVWVPESEGYVIKNFNPIRSQITDGYGKGDFSGNFILLEGNTPESGVVVCKKKYFEDNYVKHGLSGYYWDSTSSSYKPATNVDYVAVLDNSNLAKNKQYFENMEELKEALFTKTIADIDFELYSFEATSGDTSGMRQQKDVGAANAGYKYYTGDTVNKGFFMFNTYGTCSAYYYRDKDGDHYVTNYKTDGVCNIAIRVGELDIKDITTNSTAKFETNTPKYTPKTFANSLSFDELETGFIDGKLGCTQAVYLLQHVKKYTIPAHYEDVIDYPYCIYDSYSKIEQEPWFEHSICSSLTEALEVVKNLKDKIGLENVKLVKLVAIDQAVKIR